MKMRIPSVPLITVDPYFSVWSPYNKLHDGATEHWTSGKNRMLGTIDVDGTRFLFMGDDRTLPKLPQISLECDVFTTTYIFANDQIKLTAQFTSPLLIEDLYYASRPVSYLKISCEALDCGKHHITVKVACSEEFVLNRAGEGRAWSREVTVDGAKAIQMGNGVQNVLWRSGDDVRIDWGYFYLAVKGDGTVGNMSYQDLYGVYAESTFFGAKKDILFAFAYDDIHSINYFGTLIDAYWKKDGKTILCAIAEALAEYETLKARCDEFSEKMIAEATQKGGDEYAELITLAYRQVMAAHKLAIAPDGNIVYISKECFSGGCAATVDVTYPSAPLYLKYNTELLKGMIRPVIHYARSDVWHFDFAPHDVGEYPLVIGQMYGVTEKGVQLDKQMPVEESGNLIVLISAICEKENNYAFASENMDLLCQWKNYLVQYGLDPENQLCTDDFAGHMAHNCNLAIKAIMGMAGYAAILTHMGQRQEADDLMQLARDYAKSWCERAKNDDGSYRLAFDRPDTFSLKYNAVWDKLWKTNIFPESFFENEIKRYKKELRPYGVPLDSRELYTKSDWLLWVACLAEQKEDFALLIHSIWLAFSTMRTRVPMADWYFTDTSEMREFRHRTVQGGLFLKMLFD